MSGQPEFFEAIRRKSAGRWDQLEQDPELAGPWHQLFRQVQSPRHVLSELLQNADDANATEASVRIQEGRFVFEHNGDDFSAEHFASLCRFGFSNKRALHTIGFRGIGFKSTFSLGDRVELHTPTLSVAFDRKRFTEPKWIAETRPSGGKTAVTISIADPLRQREIEKNLRDWLASPVSLLFFRNIRRVQIGEAEIRWEALRSGPVADSEWMAMNGDLSQSVLFVRSLEEPFPEEVLSEIKDERSLNSGEDLNFPPCRVDVVLGAKGRLFVVLPTEVEPPLPFACNAPFIQDPARLKIKDPETSPTNRWLLDRVGALAAKTMLQWLGDGSRDPSERSSAYNLMPDVDRQDSSLAGACATAVEESFERTIADASFLLT